MGWCDVAGSVEWGKRLMQAGRAWPALAGHFCLCVLLAGSVHPAHASTVDRYRDQLAVADQTAETRRAAFKTAMQHVMLRLTGTRAAMSNPQIADALAHAQRYVQRFEYVHGTAEKAGDTPAASLLEVRFDAKAMDALADAAGLPIWSAERPDLVVWLALDDGHGRRLIGESDRMVVQSLTNRAALRGVPLLFPLLDLQEQSVLSVGEVWGGYTQQLVSLSQRYGAQGILIGRVFPLSDHHWSVRWQLLGLGRPEYWSETLIGDLDTALAEAADHTADWMAQRYAMNSAIQQSGRYHLLVAGMTQLAELSRVVSYLTGLSAVSNVMPVRLHGDVVEFALELNGSLDQLVNVLAFSDVLAPSDRVVEENGTLHVRLRP